MKQIKVIKGVKQFSVYNDIEVIVFNDKLLIGDKEFNATERDDYFVDNGVLVKRDVRELTGKHSIYVNGHFEDFPIKYKSISRFSPEEYFTTEYEEGGIEKYCFNDYDREYNFAINVPRQSYLSHYDSHSSILMIPLWNKKTLAFYTKTGQKLWEYQEEGEDLEINGSCIPVVDDVVVVISEECLVPKVIRGFNIRTGEKLWERKDVEDICPGTLFLGPDNMLYGCFSDAESPLESSNLFLTKLNPLTGDIEVTKVAGGEWFDVMPWLVTMHGNKLYYTDNRKGNEVGVIDVEKKKLVERMPLNIKKKVTNGAPVVTEDKVYVFIQDMKELRVFEK